MAEAHRFALRVYYEDTDLAGIVYHANYLRFIERARSEALREAGVDQRALQAEAGLVFVVTAIEARFRAPARLDDALEVTTRLAALGGASCRLEQRVRCGERLVFEALVTLALMDRAGRPQRLSPEIRCAFEGLGKV